MRIEDSIVFYFDFFPSRESLDLSVSLHGELFLAKGNVLLQAHQGFFTMSFKDRVHLVWWCRRGSDLFAPNLSRRGSYNVPSRRASNIEVSEEALQSLLKISERRLSLPRNPIHLLPPGQDTKLTPSIEISHYD